MTEYTMAFKCGNKLIWRNCKAENEKDANKKFSNLKVGYPAYSGAMLESNYSKKVN